MARPRVISADEAARIFPQNRYIWRTNKRGQAILVSVSKKHKFARGKGIRMEFKRRSQLTGSLSNVKGNQQRAEKLAGVKRGTGLFDDPLSSTPTVIGVTRVVRKPQLKRLLRQQAAGKNVKIPKRLTLTRNELKQISRQGAPKVLKSPSEVKLPRSISFSDFQKARGISRS